ncbi:uncharacterized protein TRAVEDRAFT_48684 [Trametes versicolor FP-101664 SS1]|uniref:uncharacterized protein n=1 Tax=Trametes versicolor (strain FP-101664) TaxID=717944 RepID=UPI0004622870|nr:uncharacterized protein TRAVEDRAFT_48684 [Trametes versicolor FP-101664 SS1]EIW57655.1 hypothetical protein TRAVEDRAFT_48684 [Trametes versicolor FP-101664 SS1]
MQFTLNFFLVLSVFSLAVAAAPAAEAINARNVDACVDIAGRSVPSPDACF